MESGRAAHFVAGNEVFYGHYHCVLQKTRFTICHPQFVAQLKTQKENTFPLACKTRDGGKI